MSVDKDDFKAVADKQADHSGRIIRLEEKVTVVEANQAKFVERTEFAPVKLIAYGLATAVMSSVLMAILAKVIIK